MVVVGGAGVPVGPLPRECGVVAGQELAVAVQPDGRAHVGVGAQAARARTRSSTRYCKAHKDQQRVPRPCLCGAAGWGVLMRARSQAGHARGCVC